jgi:cytochrome bd ubiquinol oxidase subunit II
LSPFALLCGLGLCLGYALLGACWLLVFLFVVFVYALAAHLAVMDRWLERPFLLVFPAIGVVAMAHLAHGVLWRRDGVPFAMVALIFAAAFGTLAISFWPYMIPFSITIDAAAAPHASLAFMFWGAGLFVFPLMLIYAAVNYSVFRGKVHPRSEHY